MKIGTSIDDLVMKGANGAVKTWNWTTGKTKTDLANTLVGIAPITDTVVPIVNSHPIMGIIIGGVSLGVSHYLQKTYNSFEKKEKSALEKNAKDFDNEGTKEVLSLSGYVQGVLSMNYVLGYLSNNNLSDLGFSIGFGLRGASMHVMRVEDMPRRKNALARGWDWAKEKTSNYDFGGSHEPVPIPMSHYSESEERDYEGLELKLA